MGFSAQKYRREQQPRKWRIHPVWRGIGCAFILLLPIMSWYAASLFLQTYQQIRLPWDLSKPLTLRYSHIAEIDRVITDINHFTVANDLALGQFLFTIIIMIIGFGVLSAVYAIIYSIVGPPRYGPLDVPPSSMSR